MVVVRRILICLTSTSTVIWEIRGRPNFTWRPLLWQGMKVQDATLEQWRHSPEIWTELLKALDHCCICWVISCRSCFENGNIDRESLNSTLTAYNTSCGEMRSQARDAYFVVFKV